MDDDSSSAYSNEQYSVASEASRGGLCDKGKRGETRIRSGLFTIKRRCETGKMKKIHLFNTEDRQNSQIINAVTGIPYNDESNDSIKFRLGSEHENSIFKVKYLTRENRMPGLVLCYDSPEQYERHVFCTLPQAIKTAWEEKHLYYRISMR
jgi:hypothetical protein